MPGSTRNWMFVTDQWNLFRVNGSTYSLNASPRPRPHRNTNPRWTVNRGLVSSQVSHWNIAEVIFYDRNLKADEYMAVEQYLNLKYDINQTSWQLIGSRFVRLTSAANISLIVSEIEVFARFSDGSERKITFPRVFPHISNLVSPQNGGLRCFDGLKTTYCATSNVNTYETILIDLGQPYNLSRIELFTVEQSFSTGLVRAKVECLDHQLQQMVQVVLPNRGAPSYAVRFSSSSVTTSFQPFPEETMPLDGMTRFLWIVSAPGKLLETQEVEVYDDELNFITIKDVFASSIRRDAAFPPNAVFDGFINRYQKGRNLKTGTTPLNSSEWSPLYSSQKRQQNYLILDLGNDYFISHVKVWARSDCCDDSLIGAQVRGQDAYGTFLWSATMKNYATMYTLPGDSYEVDTDYPGVQYINITGTLGKVLTLSEIEIYTLGAVRVPIRSLTASGKDVNALTFLYECIDGNATSFCQTSVGRPPFFFIDLESPVDIQKLVIRNRRSQNDTLMGATVSYFAADWSSMGRFTLGSVVPVDTYTLPSEMFCDFGSFRDPETAQCTLCPADTYKDTFSNAASCTPCPKFRSTNRARGAIALSGCSACLLGYNLTASGCVLLDQENPPEQASNLYAIIGGSAGAVVLIIVVAMSSYVHRMSKKAKRMAKSQELLAKEVMDTLNKTMASAMYNTASMQAQNTLAQTSMFMTLNSVNSATMYQTQMAVQAQKQQEDALKSHEEDQMNMMMLNALSVVMQKTEESESSDEEKKKKKKKKKKKRRESAADHEDEVRNPPDANDIDAMRRFSLSPDVPVKMNPEEVEQMFQDDINYLENLVQDGVTNETGLLEATNQQEMNGYNWAYQPNKAYPDDNGSYQKDGQ